MAITNITVAQISGAKLFVDTVNANAAVAISTTAVSLYELEMDNTANAAISYVKFWDLGTGSVTVGTTAPFMVLMVPASTKITAVFTGGVAFATAISAATVTTAGTAGTTSPTSSFILKAVYA